MTEAMRGMAKEELDTPCLVIDLDVLEHNLKKMAGSVQAELRPHTKTHRCATLAKKQLAAGAIGVTCTKVGAAEALAKAGINDILIANQVTGPPRKIARLLDLASETHVRVLVDNPVNVKELSVAAETRKMELHVLIELDVGRHRCGVPPGEPALELARTVVNSRGLVLDGLEFYEGHVSRIPDFDERKRETEKTLELAIQTKEQIKKAGMDVEIISGGATGSYAITGNYPGITEIHPGSYVFMHTKYRPTMPEFAYALTVLGTVVSTPSPNRAIIDAGSTSMTQDLGIPTLIHPKDWRLTLLQEAHGFLERIGGPPLAVGDQVELIPSHSCTTSNLYDQFFVCRNGALVDVWPISMRGKIQ